MKRHACLFSLFVFVIGCSTPYVRQWDSRLWQTFGDSDNQNEAIGRLEANNLIFDVLCTQFRNVSNPNSSIIGISVVCRNETGDTFLLEENPIQVIRDSGVVVRSMPSETVMYRLYGGDLRLIAQADRLDDPIRIHSDGTVLGDVMQLIVGIYRLHENDAIIHEFHKREALPHELFYESFVPTSIPDGISMQWTQYYPMTSETLRVMLMGDVIENAVIFEKPQPTPLPPEIVKTGNVGKDGGVVLAIALGFLTLVVVASIR